MLKNVVRKIAAYFGSKTIRNFIKSSAVFSLLRQKRNVSVVFQMNYLNEDVKDCCYSHFEGKEFY